MCNANESIITKVEELMDLRKLAEELQNQMDAITDEIKAYMGDEGFLEFRPWPDELRCAQRSAGRRAD